ncbi:MAG: hypothetical protein RL701_5010 [Pseudomonadota bacterium]
MEIARFLLDAAKRNRWTCIGVGVLVALLGTAVVSALPRTYQSTSKIYASSTGLITSQLTSGRRLLGDDAALRDISESVFNHANLVSLIRDAKLVETWPQTRNWFQRSIDRTRVALRGPTSPEDMEDMLLPMLEQSIAVKAEDSASIRFHASWRDAGVAQKLTELLQRNYLASKESEELAAITRATTVLEGELKLADAAFAPAVSELREQITALREQSKSKLAQSERVPAAAPSTVNTVVRSVTAPPLELTAKLGALRDEERLILEPWQRRNADLKFQLADLSAVYGPAHPAVVQLESKLKASSAEPVELLDLRQREAELKAGLANWAVTGHASTATSTLGAITARPLREQDSLRELVANIADDPRLAPARIQLEAVLRKSQEMKGRLDAARMERAIVQVGFKYRYREIEPARYWEKPIKPKLPALMAGVVVATLVIGFLAGAARELISGRIMEEWQVRQLGVEVVARIYVGDAGDADRYKDA